MVPQTTSPRPFPTMPSNDLADYESLDDYRSAWDAWATEHDLVMAERVALMDAVEAEWEQRQFNDELDAQAVFFQECDAVRDLQTDVMFHTPYESYGNIHDWAEAENAGVVA